MSSFEKEKTRTWRGLIQNITSFYIVILLNSLSYPYTVHIMYTQYFKLKFTVSYHYCEELKMEVRLSAFCSGVRINTTSIHKPYAVINTHSTLTLQWLISKSLLSYVNSFIKIQLHLHSTRPTLRTQTLCTVHPIC